MAARKATIVRVEKARRSFKMSQEDVAAACGISQGHYSKMTRHIVPAGPKAEAALRDWLQSSGASKRGKAQAADKPSLVRTLVESIQRDLAELSKLVGESERTNTRGR